MASNRSHQYCTSEEVLEAVFALPSDIEQSEDELEGQDDTEFNKSVTQCVSGFDTATASDEDSVTGSDGQGRLHHINLGANAPRKK